MTNQGSHLLIEQKFNPLKEFDTERTDSLTTGKQQTQIIDDFKSFNQLRDLWNSLNSGFDSPMQDFVWSQTCLESVCSDDNLQLVIRHQSDKSVALAPLTRQKGILPVMQMLGVGRLYEPTDFLYTDIAAIDALAETLRNLGNPLCLDNFPLDSPVIPALQKAYQGRAWMHIRPVNACPYIPLSQAWAEPETQFNSGRRSDFRRAQRHAERLGTVTYEILSPKPEEVAPLLTEAFQVEAQSWKGKLGTDLITDKAIADFYLQYAIKASQRGTLRVCFMRIDGQAIAMQIAVEYASRFWLLKVGYNEAFSRCSAGNLLMLHTVKYAAEQGLQSYEFLGSAEAWTKVWTELVRPYGLVRVYPFNLRGLFYFATDAAQSVWNRVKRLWEKD